MDNLVVAFVCPNQPVNFTLLPGDELSVRMSSITPLNIQLLMMNSSISK